MGSLIFAGHDVIINAFNEISGMDRKWRRFGRRGKTEPEVEVVEMPETMMKSELEHMAEVVKGVEVETDGSKSLTSLEIGEDDGTREIDEGGKKRFKFKCCC